MKTDKGIFSALLIPFDNQGKVDTVTLRQIVRHNVDHVQVDGLYVGGSTGENFLLSLEDKKEIFAVVTQEVNNQVTLIAQVGGLNVLEAQELAKYVEELGGYDYISAVTPFYYRFSFAEIKSYYDQISQVTNLPMIIYVISALTGQSFTLDEFAQLYANPKIVGCKFSNVDFYTLERLKSRFPDYKVYFGSDENLASSLVFNIDGAIGSTFNINGRIAKKIYKAMQEGNLAEAVSQQGQLNDFIDVILKNGLYRALKHMFTHYGVNSTHMRTPSLDITAEQIKAVDKLYLEFKDKI